MMNHELSATEHQMLADRIRALSTPMAPQPTGHSELLAPLEGIRCVLFDVYGTMLISGSGDVGAGNASIDDDAAFREAVVAAGLASANIVEGISGVALIESAIRQSHARSAAAGVEFPEVDIPEIWREVVERISQGSGDERVTPEALRRVAVEYECRTNPVWPMPELAETLASLRDKRMLLGIVSNAQFYTPLLFETLLAKPLDGLGFHPELCAWSYRLGQGKPATRMFAQVLERLHQRWGISPHEALYVGNDVLKDIWPASVLGCRTALFAGDRRSLRLRENDRRCAGVEADLIITRLGRLAEL